MNVLSLQPKLTWHTHIDTLTHIHTDTFLHICTDSHANAPIVTLTRTHKYILRNSHTHTMHSDILMQIFTSLHTDTPTLIPALSHNDTRSWLCSLHPQSPDPTRLCLSAEGGHRAVQAGAAGAQHRAPFWWAVMPPTGCTGWCHFPQAHVSHITCSTHAQNTSRIHSPSAHSSRVHHNTYQMCVLT